MIKTIFLTVAAMAFAEDEPASKDLKILFENLSGEGMSVIYSGNFKLDGKNYGPWTGKEAFLAHMPRKSDAVSHWAAFDDRFIVRTPDSEEGPGFQIAVSVYKDDKGDDYPYSIVFQNIELGAHAEPIELAHGGDNAEEYTWIEVESFVAHKTFGNNGFTLRNADNEPIVKITPFDADNDEL